MHSHYKKYEENLCFFIDRTNPAHPGGTSVQGLKLYTMKNQSKPMWRRLHLPLKHPTRPSSHHIRIWIVPHWTRLFLTWPPGWYDYMYACLYVCLHVWLCTYVYDYVCVLVNSCLMSNNRVLQETQRHAGTRLAIPPMILTNIGLRMPLFNVYRFCQDWMLGVMCYGNVCRNVCTNGLVARSCEKTPAGIWTIDFVLGIIWFGGNPCRKYTENQGICDRKKAYEKYKK